MEEPGKTLLVKKRYALNRLKYQHLIVLWTIIWEGRRCAQCLRFDGVFCVVVSQVLTCEVFAGLKKDTVWTRKIFEMTLPT